MTKTVFDHVKAIMEYQSLDYFDDLSDADKKAYQSYMVNRIISMNPSYIPIVNEVQQYGLLSPRASYLFYSQLLPKSKSFFRYIKVSKTTTYDTWLVELLASHFQVSQADAIDYLDILFLTPMGKQELRSLCEDYGIEQKIIKKLKI